jgi:rhodanese-related sulfurtransferase
MIRPRNVSTVFLLLSLSALPLVACGVDGNAAPSSGAQPSEIQIVPVEGEGSYTTVTAAGLATMLEDKDFPLINVHIPYEGEIEGTDLFLPFNEIEEALDELPTNKNARLVLYCRSGSMGATAARTLVGLGYTDVWNLDGGMISWKRAGYPILENSP